MADNQVTVELIAKIDALISGLNEAKAAVTGATGQIASDVHGMAEAVEKEEGLMHTALSGAVFLEYEEFAKQAFEAIQEGFEATVGKAEEFGLANAKVASMMHTTDADAAGLAAALHGVGSSTAAYEGIALRLQKTLETGTGAAAYFGEALKGPNGEALTGMPLMDRLREVLAGYSEEGKNAAVVALGLGRRYSDLYDIMRVGTADVERQKEIYASFNVNIDDTKEASEALEEKMNDFHTTVDAIEISLGQKLLPAVTSFMTSLDNAKPLVDAIQVSLAALITVVGVVRVAFQQAGNIIYTTFAEIFDVLKGVGTQIGDILSGNFKALASDGAATMAEMKSDATDYWERNKDEANEFLDLMHKLWGEEETHDKEKAQGGFAGFAGPLPGSGGPAHKGGGSKGSTGPDKQQEEDIANEKKVGLDKIAIEEATNSHLLSMGAESNAAFVAQATALENQKFAIEQAALKNELELAGQSQASKEKILDQMQQLQTTHEGKLLAIEQSGESARRATSQAELQEFIKDSDEKLKVATDGLNRQFEAGKISAAGRYQAEVELTNQIKGAEVERLNALLADLTPGTEAYKVAYKEREKVVKDWAHATDEDTKKLMTDMKKDVEEATKGFQSSFNSAFNNMLLHGKSFTDGMKEMTMGMAQAMLTMFEQMGERWVAQQITDALAGHAIQAASAESKVVSEAALAGAGGFASAMASIPYPGNVVAAPVVGAAASAAVMASFGPGATAAGGMLLDRDQLVFAHKGEQVLPAHLSDGIQKMVAGGGGSGAVHFNYAPTIHAQEPKSLAQMLQSESSAMLGYISARARDGSLRRNM